VKLATDPRVRLGEFAHYLREHGFALGYAEIELMVQAAAALPLAQARQIKNQEIADELALPPVKVHCSVLAEDAIKAAINDYAAKRKPG